MIFFFVNSIDGKVAFLEDEEYVHCCKVLRKRVGDSIAITDGLGQSGMAVIDSISKKSAQLTIQSISKNEVPHNNYTIAIAPPKNRSRWEFFVEKSVEIGVHHIIPLKTKNSERIKINIDRSKKIIRSAAIQSMQHYHPSITDTISFSNLMEMAQQYDLRYIAHYNPDNNDLRQEIIQKQSVIILVGPEGDFTEEELNNATQNDFITVNISNNRLRTETAGIVALTHIIT
jgi:16S rRNA (uracil1498-N3)-methyltransferase